MRLPTGLFCAILVIFVFFMLFKIENQLVNNSNEELKSAAEAFQQSEKMRTEANFEFQLQTRFDVFREQLYRDPDSLFRVEEPEVLRQLPPHSLALAIVAADGTIEKFTDLRGHTSREFVERFIEIDYLVVEEQRDVFLGDQYLDKLAVADKLLAEFIGVSSDRVAYKQIRASRLSFFESVDRVLALYWDNQTLNDGRKAYFFSKLDLTGTVSDYHLRGLLSINADDDVFRAFYLPAQNKFIADRKFAELQKTPIFMTVMNVCREVVDPTLVEQQNVGLVNAGNLIGIVGRPMFSGGVLPISLVDSQQRKRIIDRTSQFGIWFLIFASAGLIAFVQTFCLGRGMRLTVGRVLLIACLAAIFMPFMMGRSIFRMILVEASESGRLKLERDLHAVVSSIDSGSRLFHANMFHYFKSLVNTEAAVRALKKEEELESQGLIPENPAETTDSESLDFVNQLARKIFEPFLQGVQLTEDTNLKASAVAIMGAKGFVRFFDRFKSFTFTTGRLPDTDPTFLILNLFRRAIERFFRPDEFAPGVALQDKIGKKGELEQFKFEEIRRHIAASVGHDKVYSMLTNFEGLSNFRTSIGVVNFAVFPLRFNDLIHYFCGISWDEYTVSRVYLARVFASLASDEPAKTPPQKTFFELIDPASHISRPKQFIQAYGHFRGDMLYSGTKESSQLGILLKAGQRSRRSVKLVGYGDDEAIYYILPGRFFTLYIVGGMQETAFLKTVEDWRASMLLAGILIFILFAALAAINISRSVSSPLEHLLWGIGMIDRSDYDVRLNDDREDEFGSISRAFNLMARRLRERDTLGRFVSPAVRKLAGNPQLFQAAMRGSEATVTILFVALRGFDNFAVAAPAGRIQAKLEFVLEKFYRLARDAGGEIDKVIGGKLLIVFPHAGRGKTGAALAAVSLIRAVCKEFASDEVIQPVFGLNSGKVISGIIGTPSVRMDNTIIGDPVNVAARLCSLAEKLGQPVIVSGAIVAELKDRFDFSRVAVSSIKGKTQEVEVFSLTSI